MSEDADEGSAAESPTDYELSAVDRDMLAMERLWWKYPGAKEAAIRERFDMTSVRYYQRLGQLIDRVEALEADPVLVKRLRRQRAGGQRTRSARRGAQDL